MWEWVSQLGITAGLDTQTTKRVKLANRLSAIFMAMALLYSIITALFGLSFVAIVLVGISAVFAITPLLNNYRLYLPARLLLVASANLVIMYMVLLAGNASGCTMVFFYASTLPWVLFKEKKFALSTAGSLLSLLLFSYSYLSPQPAIIKLSPGILSFCFISSGAVTFAMLLLTIILFRADNYYAEKHLFETNKLLQDTKNRLQETLSENEAAISFIQLLYNFNNDIDELCDAGLNKLMELLGCTYGAILLYDASADMLKLQTEAGYNSDNRRALTIANGETLTGDAFLNKKTIRINNISNSYWHMRSSMGEIQPAELVIVPMTFKSQAGILEVAFLKQITNAQMALLQRLSTALAANILALKNKADNMLMAELLNQQKNELQESYKKLEELRSIAQTRMEEQYNAQQKLMVQILDKNKQKEEELLTRIAALEKQKNLS